MTFSMATLSNRTRGWIALGLLMALFIGLVCIFPPAAHAHGGFGGGRSFSGGGFRSSSSGFKSSSFKSSSFGLRSSRPVRSARYYRLKARNARLRHLSHSQETGFFPIYQPMAGMPMGSGTNIFDVCGLIFVTVLGLGFLAFVLKKTGVLS